MYSKRDQMFYLPPPGSNYLCSWDHSFKPDKIYFCQPTQAATVRVRAVGFMFQGRTLGGVSFRGTFLVKCYSLLTPSLEKELVFMVYREEETTQGGRYMCYTEDTGDLCIFLSRGDSLCLEASSSPALKPNSIYLIEPVFGVYDLATRNIRRFQAPDEDLEVDVLPYWLPPVSI